MSIGTVRMDGFWGALMAAESIRGCAAVLHGPGGCRMTVSGVSVQSVIRPFSIEEGPFYFTEPRIPATYLDDEDYINGADYKLSDLLSTVDAEAVLVVQSPGTSLIGDDLNGAAYRSGFGGTVVIQEENHMSRPFHEGYDAGITDLVQGLCGKSETKPGRVNVLGIPVTMDGWEDTVAELGGYARAMGLEPVFIGAGCSVGDVRASGSAEVCVTVLPEYCGRTSEAYGRLGVPTRILDVPVGFKGTRTWIEGLADATGRDASPALEMLSAHESRAREILRGSMQRGLMMRCATYSMDMGCSAALPLARWLHGYLAMFPAEIAVMDWWDEDYLSDFVTFLSGIGCEGSMTEALTPVRCDVVFGPGQTAALLRKRGLCSVDIAVDEPGTHRMRFIGRPFLGARGALMMLDRMFELCERD